MALQLNGNYYRVEETKASGVLFRVYKDADQRSRDKAGTLDTFETTTQEHKTLDVDLTVKADATKSIQDNLVTAGYTALKGTEEFAGSTDV
jgi:hypothetical protein